MIHSQLIQRFIMLTGKGLVVGLTIGVMVFSFQPYFNGLFDGETGYRPNNNFKVEQVSSEQVVLGLQIEEKESVVEKVINFLEEEYHKLTKSLIK